MIYFSDDDWLSFNVFDTCSSCVVNFVSSELSISCKVTTKIRFARRIIFDVLSTIIDGLKSATAFSVCWVSWMIASSENGTLVCFIVRLNERTNRKLWRIHRKVSHRRLSVEGIPFVLTIDHEEDRNVLELSVNRSN